MTKFIRNFLKHIMNYGVATIITGIGSFILVPIYTRCLTTSDYGIVDLINTASNLLSMFLPLGLNAAFSVFYYNSKNNEEIKEFFSTIINTIMIFCVIAIAVLISINSISTHYFIKNVPKNYLNICFLTSGFSIFIQFPMSMLQFREKSKQYGFLSILQFLTSTTLNIIFVVFLKKGAEGVITAQLIVAIIFFVIATILSKNLYSLYLDFNKMKSLLKVGIPVIPHATASWCITFIDRIILNNYVDTSNLGLYSFGYKIGTIMFVLVSAINQAWSPIFMKTANDRKEVAEEIFNNINRYYVVTIGIITLILCLFSKEITIIMAPKAYSNACYIMPFVFLSYFFNGLYFMVVNSLFYMKKTYFLPISTGLAAVTNIVLNLILIPKYGIYAAAVVNLITYVVLFTSVYIINLKIYKINMPVSIIMVYLFINIMSNFSVLKLNVSCVTIIIKVCLLIIISYLLYHVSINKNERTKTKQFILKVLNKV
ncbi:Membrane protein involved in the export of O-antigen and teichoic acid [Clostridium acidisoli DSM 12555]|uniref:Membrane protein involved in the export of O-antigen and teichoic acid n=1 Tax=Clostridium acidisoli DSM 12555 TaxID=1121291 RepID=A0A1W1XHG7_9CLOT|nr:oligosaccharide flippase family protein [Clostridium acidisoli]SMC23232.1 Membrane protein involved in the export of O-antigen and teichoic acid [Clostridium acidisoli DSM 12555]